MTGSRIDQDVPFSGLFCPFPAPDDPGRRLVRAVTTRHGPDFGAAAPDSPAHARLAGALARAVGLTGAAWAVQVHGGDVLAVDEPGLAGRADAMATDVPGLGLVGRSADCPQVLVTGPAVRGRGGLAWGMAHASWRSTVRGIVTRLMEVLVERFGLDPAGASAVVCPSAGPCCYEVGPEVRAAALAGLGPAADRFFARRGGRLHLDLRAAAAARLVAAGVPRERIAVNGWCTICRPDLFFSHRAEGGRAGRFAAVVGALSGNPGRADDVGSPGTSAQPQEGTR